MSNWSCVQKCCFFLLISLQYIFPFDPRWYIYFHGRFIMCFMLSTTEARNRNDLASKYGEILKNSIYVFEFCVSVTIKQLNRHETYKFLYKTNIIKLYYRGYKAFYSLSWNNRNLFRFVNWISCRKYCECKSMLINVCRLAIIC